MQACYLPKLYTIVYLEVTVFEEFIDWNYSFLPISLLANKDFEGI